MKDTSLDAFYALKQTPTLQEQQRKIISVMHPNAIYTRRDLAFLTGLETSTVSARVNSMIDVVIEIVGKTKDATTGKSVEALKLKVAA